MKEAKKKGRWGEGGGREERKWFWVLSKRKKERVRLALGWPSEKEKRAKFVMFREVSREQQKS